MATQKVNLQGVWQTTEITKLGPEAGMHPAQPGLYIFTETHYSITIVRGEKPRMATASVADASIDQLREALRFGAQAGTYETNADKLMLHPSVALRTSAMVPGTEAIYAYSVEGNTLSLSPVSNNTGSPITNQRIKLHRVA